MAWMIFMPAPWASPFKSSVNAVNTRLNEPQRVRPEVTQRHSPGGGFLVDPFFVGEGGVSAEHVLAFGFVIKVAVL